LSMHRKAAFAQPASASKLILITPYDPNDVSKWSGIPHSLYRALKEQQGSVGFTYARGVLGLLDFGARVINRALRLLGIALDCHFSAAYAMLAGAYLTIRFLFVGECTFLAIAGSNYVPYFATKRRIIYISDATFRSLSSLYPAFRAFPKWLREQGDRNEEKTLSKARFVIYPSRWASESARVDYGTPPDRLFSLPFGPNIPDTMINKYYAPKSVSDKAIALAFVSADWDRKNGDMAIAICHLLIASGLTVRMMTVGDTPEYAKALDFVEDRGFLKKSDPEQLAKLCEVYRQAHFFLLPSTADAFAIVFSEAGAFGVPSIAYDVGGVASAILHGNTGLLLPPGASAEMFANEIYRHVCAPGCYEELSRNCRVRYLNEANWRRWAEMIFRLASSS
jgi:glycosyltransferase involved in cell wall biosynthesis